MYSAPLILQPSATTTSVPPSAYFPTKTPGNIYSAFDRLNAGNALPERYLHLKQQLLEKKVDVIQDSWKRLIATFEHELKEIRQKGPDVIPQIDFELIKANGGRIPEFFEAEVKKRGVVVIRNVVNQEIALGYKQQIRDYIAAHPGKFAGFPEDRPQVWEIFWSKAQIEARQHPNFNIAAGAMNNLWHADPSTEIDLDINISYSDRIRIREKGDTYFSLGEHVDGGSVERWEDPEYRKFYTNILEGNWEAHDPFDATHRVNANMDMYNCIGGSLVYRTFQGWMSMSNVKPGGGTLRVCPLIKLTSAYMLLRPLLADMAEKADMAGAIPSVNQNISPELHPHIVQAMVSIPAVNPGDCVFWHCDGVHAVEGFCGADEDSSVLYIPSAPLCRKNVEYLLAQRETFVNGTSPPDFPLNNCEIGFEDRAFPSDLSESGKLIMGFSKFNEDASTMTESQLKAAREANKLLFG